MFSRLLIAALWSPVGKGRTSWLLFVIFNCVNVTFPCGILCQMWYLIVSIPDLCRLSYFRISNELSMEFGFVCFLNIQNGCLHWHIRNKNFDFRIVIIFIALHRIFLFKFRQITWFIKGLHFRFTGFQCCCPHVSHHKRFGSNHIVKNARQSLIASQRKDVYEGSDQHLYLYIH